MNIKTDLTVNPPITEFDSILDGANITFGMQSDLKEAASILVMTIKKDGNTIELQIVADEADILCRAIRNCLPPAGIRNNPPEYWRLIEQYEERKNSENNPK